MFISAAFAATEQVAKHGAEAGEKSDVFPPFDPSTFSSQLLWLALTFGFFYFFMARIVLPLHTPQYSIFGSPHSLQLLPPPQVSTHYRQLR